MVPEELSRKLWPSQKEGLDGLLSDWYGCVEESVVREIMLP